MTNFRTFLMENADHLDISIQAAGKYLNSQKRIEDFFNVPVLIEQKTDGVKCTVVKIRDEGNLEDYVIAYKGNILYDKEFEYQYDSRVKKESVGASQFKYVLNHFAKLGKTNVPIGTELFVEFLMKKPTLSSNYKVNHKMVLIGHSKSQHTVKFGKLKTQNTGFNTAKRYVYARELQIDVPVLLFHGVLGSETEFLKGIKHKVLKTEFAKQQTSFSWNVPELLLLDVRDLFLGIESKYGGVEEGVVLKYNSVVLKFQQEYQVDQAARLIIKMKYRENSPELETLYWNNVKRTAQELAQSITPNSRPLENVLEELAQMIKLFTFDFSHSKKTLTNIKDDVQLTAKTLLLKKMKGNNNALIIGKFRILTKDGHYKLIAKALKEFDNVVVNVVTSKTNKASKNVREQMLRATFPNVEITHSVNGNLTRIIGKSPINVNVVYAGTDRVKAYNDQLKNTLGVQVKEMSRTDSDISASAVIENIQNEKYFKTNTPKQIHNLYDELLQLYQK